MKIGYLGPEGTFSHEALSNFIEYAHVANVNTIPYLSFYFVQQYIKGIDSEKVDKIFIPIENSVGGGVVGNIDTLTEITTASNIHIEAEYIQPVQQCIGNFSGNLSDIQTISSHQQGIEQCSNYIASNLPNTAIEYTKSTQHAAVNARSNPTIGAIASEKALLAAGLKVIAINIQDNPDNATRFVLLGKDKTNPTGHDKTSIAITLPSDKPGSLYEVLEILATSTPPINMTKIESRPTKKEMGEYWFFIDIEGHHNDPIIKKVLDAIRTKSKEYKFLGSYSKYKKS